MRLAYVVSQWRRPTETFVRREIDAARAAGHQVVVLSLKEPFEICPSDPPVVWLPTTKVLRLALGPRSHRWTTTLRTLATAIRWSRPGTVLAHSYALLAGSVAASRLAAPDWVHAHFAWLPATAALGAAAQLHRPFGVMPHAHDIYETRVLDRFLGRKLRAAALVVVESPHIAADVRDRFGCDAEVLRMGVPAEFLHAPGGPRAAATVLSVGTLKDKKGHDTLIRAMARMPDATLTIVGDGPLRDALTDLVAQLGLSTRVSLVGQLPLEEVRELLDAASVFCLASRVTSEGDRDGVPNVLIEAMARAVPVVATTVSGIPDLLGQGRGALVPPDDPEALAAALRTILNDPATADQRAARAHAHIAEHYTTERNWQELEAMISARLSR